MTDWAEHFRRRSELSEDDLSFDRKDGDDRKGRGESGASFGGLLDAQPSDSDFIKQVQTVLGVKADGIWGPLSESAMKSFQLAHGIPPTGLAGDVTTLNVMGIKPPAHPSSPVINTGVAAASLRQAAKEMGFNLNDTLLSLMIAQLRHEGAYPGVGGTLGGTNNMGAAQATSSLAKAKLGQKGWGAIAHKDSSPVGGDYIGWYWMAPSPIEAARYWLSNWWGKRLLQQNPQDATTYAHILYAGPSGDGKSGHYYEGVHKDSPPDIESDAASANIADYARGISAPGVLPTAAQLAQVPSVDPASITLNPNAFKPLADRGVTEALYNKAMSGGAGSAFKGFLPASWSDFQKGGGAVWFGPPITAVAGAIAVGLGFLYWVVGGVIVIVGAMLFTGHKHGQVAPALRAKSSQ